LKLTLLNFSLFFLILFWAYVVFGITGFGQTVVAMPLLAQFSALKFCVPLILLCDLVFGSISAVRFRRRANFREILALMPSLAIGVVFGSYVLTGISDRILLICLGIFITAFGVYSLAKKSRRVFMPRLLAVPFGFLSGAIAAIFGTGGPVNVIYLSGRIEDKNELRATVATLLLLSVVFRCSAFGLRGLFSDPNIWYWWMGLLPACFLGVRLGNQLHSRLDDRKFLTVVQTALIGSGVLLLAKVF
jgi:uncharacterized protein